MKANSLEEFVTNSNIAGELRNYTDWHTRLVKFAQLVADWQKEQDERVYREFFNERNQGDASFRDLLAYKEGHRDGMEEQKDQMMKEAVEGKVNQDGILELSNGEAIDVCPSLDKCALGLQLGEKVKLVIVKDNDTE